MKHIAAIKIDLDFPFIYAEFENGEKYRYDINHMVPERSEYKKLLNEEYFYKAKLSCGGHGIEWDDFVDMHADGMITFGEKIE